MHVEHAAIEFAPNPHVAVGLNVEGNHYSTFQLEHRVNMEALLADW
jgi:hypothetical protein